MNPLSRTSVVLAAPLLLFACSQPTSPASTDPYAGGVSYPWAYTRPADQITAQTLTPGVNTLNYEPILAANNGWGPIEVNRSNGEQRAGDGHPLTLGGVTYARGFGVHAGSEMRFSLKGTGATCTRFTVDVGIDDEVGTRGRVYFQVYLDGTLTKYVGPLTGTDSAIPLDVNISGKQELRLVVTDGDDGINYDHADWANPKIYCQAIPVPITSLTMTVDPSTLQIFHKRTATVKATFSGTFNGPVNMSLPLLSPDEGSKLVLNTTQVSLPASGSGTVTRDVVISAPGLPATPGRPEWLTANYRLVASQNGQEISEPLTITEKLLTVGAYFTPSTVSGRVSETRRVTMAVTVSPPLEGPVPISLMASTSGTSAQFLQTAVGPTYGDGGTMKQDYDLTLLYGNGGGTARADYYTEAGGFIESGGFIGYRLPYYGGQARSVIWNVLP